MLIKGDVNSAVEGKECYKEIIELDSFKCFSLSRFLMTSGP
jgi:hypothetical protein